MLYRTVGQAVLLFGSGIWVLFEVMERKFKGTHTVFLRHISGKQAHQKADGRWVIPWAEVAWEAAENQLVIICIGIRQGEMAQWVVLRPIFVLCTVKKGYEGIGHRRDS